MDDSTESYLMLLLADGNLPTGSFVASSGLESFIKHGFFISPSSPLSSSNQAVASSSAQAIVNQNVVDFINDSLHSYARSALPFVSDAHQVMLEISSSTAGTRSAQCDATMRKLCSLDDLYHAMTLNDVLRRASKSQGVALLTLHSKGFSKPKLVQHPQLNSDEGDLTGIVKFVDSFKSAIRREDTHGHLPICWGVLTAALGLSLERAEYLNLFLQARSLLSAAIRLNTIGPYAAQQILLHSVKGIVDSCMFSKNIRTGLNLEESSRDSPEVVESVDCVASTWPLGEILAARHDLQHSRIFNS